MHEIQLAYFRFQFFPFISHCTYGRMVSSEWHACILLSKRDGTWGGVRETKDGEVLEVAGLGGSKPSKTMVTPEFWTGMGLSERPGEVEG